MRAFRAQLCSRLDLYDGLESSPSYRSGQGCDMGIFPKRASGNCAKMASTLPAIVQKWGRAALSKCPKVAILEGGRETRHWFWRGLGVAWALVPKRRLGGAATAPHFWHFRHSYTGTCAGPQTLFSLFLGEFHSGYGYGQVTTLYGTTFSFEKYRFFREKNVQICLQGAPNSGAHTTVTWGPPKTDGRSLEGL